jgi:hypothetical protein
VGKEQGFGLGNAVGPVRVVFSLVIGVLVVDEVVDAAVVLNFCQIKALVELVARSYVREEDIEPVGVEVELVAGHGSYFQGKGKGSLRLKEDKR